VHGLPGNERVGGNAVDLTGQLSGFGGTAAARFGYVSTISPNDQSLYRFNSCVVDTINCVATSFAQPITPVTRTDISIRNERERLDPTVLLPNIAEEDY